MTPDEKGQTIDEMLEEGIYGLTKQLLEMIKGKEEFDKKEWLAVQARSQVLRTFQTAQTSRSKRRTAPKRKFGYDESGVDKRAQAELRAALEEQMAGFGIELGEAEDADEAE